MTAADCERCPETRRAAESLAGAGALARCGCGAHFLARYPHEPAAFASVPYRARDGSVAWTSRGAAGVHSAAKARIAPSA